MKNLLVYIFCCLCPCLSGQIVKKDTFFYPPGEVSQIEYFSIADTVGQPMEKRYQLRHGFIQDYVDWKLDSTQFFRVGKHQKTALSPELKRLEQIKKHPFLQFYDEGLPKNLRSFSNNFGMVEFVRVTGYANKKTSFELDAYVIGEQAITIGVVEKPDWLSLPNFQGTLPPGAHEITLEAHLPPGVSQTVARFLGPDQKVIDVRLALRGYDLTEADFILGINYSELEYIDVSDREHLFLRLESTEKLLNLYQDDKLRFRIPVGQQIDQIPVYNLPPGKYRMEVVDLGTGNKRSYGLKR